jgi:hypothetical protein
LIDIPEKIKILGKYYDVFFDRYTEAANNVSFKLCKIFLNQDKLLENYNFNLFYFSITKIINNELILQLNQNQMKIISNIFKFLFQNGFKLYDEIKINDRLIKIDFKSTKIPNNCGGQAKLEKNIILVESFQSDDNRNETIIHEIIHFIDDEFKLNLIENQIRLLSIAWYSVFQDNFWINENSINIFENDYKI